MFTATFRLSVRCTVAMFLLRCTSAAVGPNPDYKDAKSIYEFSAKDIYGKDVSLEKYRGHVCIIVNVASECGLTDSNYEQLVDLYRRYGQSHGLKILAFPSNEFGGQGPGGNEEILEFAKRRATFVMWPNTNWMKKATPLIIGSEVEKAFAAVQGRWRRQGGSGVEFDLFAKVEVNGENAHPLWKYLKHQQGGFLYDGIKWNFTKFLINKYGEVVERYAPTTEPEDMVDELLRQFNEKSSPHTKGEL